MKPTPNISLIRKIVKAAGYAWHGLLAAFRWEIAFRLEVYFCLVAFPLAIYLGKSPVERAILVATLFGILAAELFNTAVEAIIDRIGLERDELAKRAKDLGAAVVLIAIVNALIIWTLILL